jgi:hypothetical protein
MRRWVQVVVDTLRAQDPDHPVVGWFDDVAQPQRQHSDVQNLASAFGLSEAFTDRLFAVAMLIEQSTEDSLIEALITSPLPDPPVPQT